MSIFITIWQYLSFFNPFDRNCLWLLLFYKPWAIWPLHKHVCPFLLLFDNICAPLTPSMTIICKFCLTTSLGQLSFSYKGSKDMSVYFCCLLKRSGQHKYYSRGRKHRHPYYLSLIEIGLIWAKITYLKSHSKALVFILQTDMK